MKVIDLTHVIKEDMPVYPGTEPPRLEPANTYEKDGFKETRISMFSHTGTHMDPPAHLFPGRITLDQFPPEQFIGRAVVIDCRDLPEGKYADIPIAKAVHARTAYAYFYLKPVFTEKSGVKTLRFAGFVLTPVKK